MFALCIGKAKPITIKKIKGAYLGDIPINLMSPGYAPFIFVFYETAERKA